MFAAGNYNVAVALDEAEMLRLWAAAQKQRHWYLGEYLPRRG